jgi:hypothetical protein
VGVLEVLLEQQAQMVCLVVLAVERQALVLVE